MLCLTRARPLREFDMISFSSRPTRAVVILTALTVVLLMLSAAAVFVVHSIHTHPSEPLPTMAANSRAPAAGPDSAALVNYLAEQYRVTQTLAEQVVALTWMHAPATEIDPLLVLAIIGVESSLNPKAESQMGAQGLMQIMPRFHSARLQSQPAGASFFDPAVNISIGIEILRELLDSSNGEERTALQRYNGALVDREARYAQRVFAERDRLQAALQARAPTAPDPSS
jgi:soluble lytic murein transglycosylase-like protein